jgi:hypothetical protein
MIIERMGCFGTRHDGECGADGGEEKVTWLKAAH